MRAFIQYLLLTFLFVFTTNISICQTTVTPVRYWTFNNSNTALDSTGGANLNFTNYSSQYTTNIECSGKSLTFTGTGAITLAGSPTFTNDIAMEFLLKPQMFFQRNATIISHDPLMSVSFEFPYLYFFTTHKNSNGVTINDEFKITLDGIGRKSYGYYIDGNWHHFVFKFNTLTGVKQIWIDGQLPAGFSKNIAIGTFVGISNGSLGVYLNNNTSFAKYYGSIDDVAIYNVDVPAALIYKHYLGVQNCQPYSYLNNYVGTIPAPSPVTAGIDTLEYPIGHPNVTTLPTVQLSNFPAPRYKVGHTLKRNFNWMNPDYMGGQFQSWSPTNTTVAQYGTELQAELAKNYNYYFNVPIDQSSDPRYVMAVNYVNANLDVPVSMITLRVQLNGNAPDLRNQNKASNFYLQNSSGQFIAEDGSVTTNKLWRPSAPANGYIADGNTILSKLNGLTQLNRNISIINENAELFPHYTGTTLALDPAVVTDKNNTGLSWEKYIGLRIKDNEVQSYRNVFMAHPKLANGIFTEYTIGGQPTYQKDYEYRRLINSPINGQYYSTNDFYPRWPNNWRYWNSAWHGWQWFVEGRYQEILLGDKLQSPFVAAGWDANEEVNIRPSQWLGLLKCMNNLGSEFYYTGHFSEAPPWPDSRNWIWQASTPSYAQAITSRYEDLLRNGSLMAGDVPSDYASNPTQPGYSFNANDPRKLIVVRKHNTLNKYVIAGTIQPQNNQKNSAELTGTAKITLDGQAITFTVRRQGSVYIYDKTGTTPVFYQLDEWHESSHPQRWSKDFIFEAELFDNASNGVIKTESTPNTAVNNFVNSTSYLSWITTPVPTEYHFNNRAVNNYYLWVRAKSKDGTTTGMSIKLDGGTSKIINCITDTNWVWYRYESPSNSVISYNSVSVGNHILNIVASNDKLFIDKTILTLNPSLNLNNNGPNCSTVIATITALGPTTFCQGKSVTLTANTGVAYLWNNGATTQSITVTTAGTFFATITTANGVATSNSITTAINPLPTVSISPSGSSSICAGQTIILTASTNHQYLWSTGFTSQTMPANSSGNYFVTVTNTNGCTAQSASVNIVVNLLPNVSVTPSGPTTFCQGQSVTLTASGGNQYLWSNGSISQSINVNTTGSYFVTVTNANNCTAQSGAINVVVNPLPIASITASGSTVICAGQLVNLSASSGSSYIWSNGATTQNVTVNTSGTYTVTVTNSSSCSAVSAPIGIIVNTSPIATITPSGSTTICTGQSVTLTASSGSQYLWSTGATSQSINATVSGNYIVTVTNSNSCTAVSSAQSVIVNNCSTCNVPTNLNNTNIQSTTATLTWDAVPNASQGYTIKLKNVLTQNVTYINANTNTSTIFVNPGTKYRWSVRSKCAGILKSSFSITKIFTTPSSRMANGMAETDNETLNERESETLFVYPNPATKEINILFESADESNAQLKITDDIGKIFYYQDISLKIGMNNFKINTSNFPPNVYLVFIIKEKNFYVKKFIKIT